MTDNIKHPPYDELLAFLPQLERLGPDDVYLPDRPDEEPEIDDQGNPIYFFQSAEYSPVVERFFEVLGQDHWLDRNYDPAEAGSIAESADALARCSLEQLKQVFTWMVRGERFCDGHRGAVVKSGVAVRALRRLGKLAKEG